MVSIFPSIYLQKTKVNGFKDEKTARHTDDLLKMKANSLSWRLELNPAASKNLIFSIKYYSAWFEMAFENVVQTVLIA